jgi:hypothetical protein
MSEDGKCNRIIFSAIARRPADVTGKRVFHADFGLKIPKTLPMTKILATGRILY